MRFQNRGKFPKTGGVLVLANHLSDCDPIPVQLACPRPIYFMGKSELFEMAVVGSALRLMRTFPVKRGEPDRTALQYAINLLKQGHVVCVFPEGQLSEDGCLQDLKPGVALIARMADCPVMCLGLKNTDRVIRYGNLHPSFGFCWVTAAWGKPQKFAKEVGDGTLAFQELLPWVSEQLLALGAKERSQ